MEEHCFLIFYDLRGADRDYADLIAAIKKYRFWGHLTESSWAVLSSKSAIEIRDELRKMMADEDRLMVVQSGRNAAWHKCLASDGWILDNIVK